jgi:hypothetical protein
MNSGIDATTARNDEVGALDLFLIITLVMRLSLDCCFA